MKNAAAGQMETPRGTISNPQGKLQVVNQAENYTGPVIVIVLAVFVLPFVLKFFVVDLYDAIGSTYPDREAASLILGFFKVVFLFALVSGGTWVFSRFILTPYFEHSERLKDKDAQIAEANARFVQKQLPAQAQARMLSEDVRFYRAVMMAMDKAFQWCDEDGNLMTRNEPWSRRTVGRFTLLNETDPIGENSTLATRVKDWLLDNEVLVNDRKFDRDTFDDLDAIHNLLVSELGALPISVNSHARDRGDGSQTFSVIENSY
jgi:hypothetical protein